MSNCKGQTLLEFILVFVVLLMATTGVLSLYKNFWQIKYKKASVISGISAGVLKNSKYRIDYVK